MQTKGLTKLSQPLEQVYALRNGYHIHTITAKARSISEYVPNFSDFITDIPTLKHPTWQYAMLY